jgi:hypothetical protein
MTLIKTNFVPKDHGFHFVNSFEPAILGRIKLPFISRALGDIIYGLCGGMCFGALDYFFAHKSVPAYRLVDDIDYRLFRYLWERQMDSLESNVIPKLVKWMFYADSTVMRRMVAEEAPALRASIDQGSPAVLALVRQGGFSDPTQNHQVLAISYEVEPASQVMTVHLYDPNYPGESPTLSLNLSKPVQGMASSKPHDKVPRGFFIIPYSRKTPP